MPSVFSHAIAAVALGSVAVGRRSRAIVWSLGALCAVAPDLDAVTSFLFRIPYRAMLGHRGLSHSLLVAAVLALLVTVIVRRARLASPGPARLWRPILVSPISLPVFFGYRGLRVMWSELGWIWLPAAVVLLAGLVRRRRDSDSTSRKPLSGVT